MKSQNNNSINQRLNDLILKHLTASSTPAEEKELAQLILQENENDQLLAILENAWNAHLPIASMDSKTAEAIIRAIILPSENSIASPRPIIVMRNSWWRLAGAAILLFSILTGTYLLLKESVGKKNQPTNLGVKDVAPGSYKAELLLADGKKVLLNDVKRDTVAVQGNAIVTKSNNRQLVYGLPASAPHEVLYNTLTTPRGGQYEITLSDGTKVWLNAASSLKYPTAFISKERNVELTGEAYFEVAKSKSLPFIVSVGGQTVQVLGTHFNINAYADEPAIKTTLVEGSVKILSHGNHALLKPGQQAETNITTNLISINNNADIAQAMAWKNGLFQFKNASIETVMQQFARWYDVEVVYEGNIPSREISGKIHRNVKASEALQIVSYLNVHFRIESQLGKKRIILTP